MSDGLTTGRWRDDVPQSDWQCPDADTIRARPLPAPRAGRRRGRPGFLEIGPHDLLRSHIPEQVAYISTRFRWQDRLGFIASADALTTRLRRLAAEYWRALGLAWRQDFDVVVTRCLGPVNSSKNTLMVHLARLAMGLGLEALARFASRGSRVKLVVIDPWDHMTIHPRDRRLFHRCDLYFKRELSDSIWQSLETVLPRGSSSISAGFSPKAAAMESKLRPFAIGIDPREIQPPVPCRDKKYDVFFSGWSNQTILRRSIPESMSVLADRGWRTFAPEQKLSHDEFREAIRQSRLCLSPGGFGWDCYRHYEIVACGSIPVMSFRTLRSIAPFEHGRDCFYYDPQGKTVDALDEWLRIPDGQLDQMVLAAQGRLRRHYTFEALARYVLAEIAGIDSP